MEHIFSIYFSVFLFCAVAGILIGFLDDWYAPVEIFFGVLKWTAVLGTIGTVLMLALSWYQNLPSTLERDRKEAMLDQQNKVPRLLSEKDGCKVYAFKAGDRWHYFTRCEKETTTDTSYGERQGKTPVERHDSIKTENQ